MAHWRSVVELEDYIQALPETDKLDRLHAISFLFRYCVFSSGYEAAPRLADLIHLTESGKEVVQGSEQLRDMRTEDVLLAMLGLLTHRDVLVDWRTTNIDGLCRAFEAEFLADRIRLPYRHGRLLYDRFNDLSDSGHTNFLPSPDVWRLLDGTPVGVFQIEDLITGPLGLIHSSQSRFVPPTLKLPLWHCSDTGCQSLHSVGLIPPQIAVVQAYDILGRELQNQFGPASEWESILWRRHIKPDQERERRFFDVPLLIGDCIIGTERTALLHYVLQTQDGSVIRKVLAAKKSLKPLSSLPSDTLGSRLSTEEQLQVLLLAGDEALGRAIDACVLAKTIRVPLSEIRRPRAVPPSRSFDRKSELSSLGIRMAYENPFVQLVTSIWKAYADSELQNELQWRLGTESPENSQTALCDYVREYGPAAAISNLVLSSRPVSELICNRIGLAVDDVKNKAASCVPRLLWKFGFDIPRFDEFFERFRSRIEKFHEVALASDPSLGENDRERIRSESANLFVSVEEFLDSLISYNVWLLAADHFLEAPKFAYRIGQARRSVRDNLGECLVTDGIELRWDSNGKNTLGVLLRYLAESVAWMSRLSTENRDTHLRPEADLPDFIEHTDRIFPFRHTQLWADADPRILQLHIQGFERICKLLGQTSLAGVRNGLEHKRDELDFPSLDSILACVARLREAVELSDSLRYFPKTFWLFERTTDRFGAITLRFRDYRDKMLVLYAPSIATGRAPSQFETPMIIAPHNLIGLPNATLLFRAHGHSIYSDYWTGYPRRRRVPPKKDDGIGDDRRLESPEVENAYSGQPTHPS